MKKESIALLEFDKNKKSKFSPECFDTTPKNLPKKCVIAFSYQSVEKLAKKYGVNRYCGICSCTCDLPCYVIDYEGEKIVVTTGFLGSAGAAAQIEELYAGGVRKIVACGSCGTLLSNPLGALVVPNCALRDEGASFHYAPPSYEIDADIKVAESIGNTLKSMGLPYVYGKTWTTDGLYRETEEKILLRQNQGCITVEMECAAMIAVSKFRGIEFGQILYCGDDLSKQDYDHRNFYNAQQVRDDLLEYALKCVRNL